MGESLVPLQAVGYAIWFLYLQRSIYRYIFFIYWH